MMYVIAPLRIDQHRTQVTSLLPLPWYRQRSRAELWCSEARVGAPKEDAALSPRSPPVGIEHGRLFTALRNS